MIFIMNASFKKGHLCHARNSYDQIMRKQNIRAYENLTGTLFPLRDFLLRPFLFETSSGPAEGVPNLVHRICLGPGF